MSPRRDRKSETTTREKWPQKTAFLLASYQLQVSEDCVVETVDIELAAHHAVIELVSKSASGTGIFNAETSRKNRVMCRKFVSRDRECFGGHTI